MGIMWFGFFFFFSPSFVLWQLLHLEHFKWLQGEVPLEKKIQVAPGPSEDVLPWGQHRTMLVRGNPGSHGHLRRSQAFAQKPSKLVPFCNICNLKIFTLETREWSSVHRWALLHPPGAFAADQGYGGLHRPHRAGEGGSAFATHWGQGSLLSMVTNWRSGLKISL